GKLRDCLARLDGCGAEPELVALCKRCLAFEPAERPCDAGEVAGAVARLRAAAEERARQAELERGRADGAREVAELKAVESRKRHRVLLALAAAVVAIVAMASVGGWWGQRQSAARDRAVAEQRAAEALRQEEEKREREADAAVVADAVEQAYRAVE